MKKVGLTARVESKQGRRIHDIDVDEYITLVNDQDDADMFGVNDLDGDEVIVDNVDVAEEVTVIIEKAKLVSAAEEIVNAAATTVSTASTILVTNVEITLAQALAELKSAKPKDDKVLIQEPEQAQEKEELTDTEKARLFVQFLEQRRKHFAAKRAEENRNKPPTRAQQRSIMCTYLKNMEGWKPKDLKNKSFANIQELFDKARKRVNTFVDYKTELVEESSKKAEAETTQERSSKRAGEELE
ncbi:hypothetical protein Tco_1395710 [Tanacetum coccineum]